MAVREFIDFLRDPPAATAVAATGVALTLGGASLALGIKPELGAAAVAGFLAGVSAIMHDFWKVEDPQKRQAEMINFSKNMALLGAALALMGTRNGKRNCHSTKPS
jgi:putative oxidoreductase